MYKYFIIKYYNFFIFSIIIYMNSLSINLSKIDYLLSIFTQTRDQVNETITLLNEVKEAEIEKEKLHESTAIAEEKLINAANNIERAELYAQIKTDELKYKTTNMVDSTLKSMNIISNIFNEYNKNESVQTTSNLFTMQYNDSIGAPFKPTINEQPTKSAMLGSSFLKLMGPETTTGAPFKSTINAQPTESSFLGLTQSNTNTTVPLFPSLFEPKPIETKSSMQLEQSPTFSGMSLEQIQSIMQTNVESPTLVTKSLNMQLEQSPMPLEQSPTFSGMSLEQIQSMMRASANVESSQLETRSSMPLETRSSMPLENISSMPLETRSSMPLETISSMPSEQSPTSSVPKPYTDIIEFGLGYSKTYASNKKVILGPVNRKGRFYKIDVSLLSQDQGWGNYCSNYTIGIMRNDEWLINNSRPAPRSANDIFINEMFIIVPDPDKPIMLEESDTVVIFLDSPWGSCVTEVMNVLIKLYIDTSMIDTPPTPETFTNTTVTTCKNKNIWFSILLFIIIIIIILLISCKK